MCRLDWRTTIFWRTKQLQASTGCIDTFTRWVELYPLRSTDAVEAAVVLHTLEHSDRNAIG